jgi:hypothetical protein
MMRAQMSLEYLMLTLVSLCLLSISVFALMGVRDYSEMEAQRFAFRSSAVSLGNAIDEVCALGSGNSREVALHHKMSVERDGDGLVFGGAGLALARECLCEIEGPGDLEGLVLVENREGMIRIRGQ